MLYVSMHFEDIDILNIEREDLIYAHKWLDLQKPHIKFTEQGWLTLKDLNERYLESYVSENEFFLKILNKKNFSGILKGRVEYKNPNEMWFWFFILDSGLHEKGIGSKIVKQSIDYFVNEYSIDNFYTVVIVEDAAYLKFWRKNGFKVLRLSKGFYNINGKEFDIFILKYDA